MLSVMMVGTNVDCTALNLQSLLQGGNINKLQHKGSSCDYSRSPRQEVPSHKTFQHGAFSTALYKWNTLRKSTSAQASSVAALLPRPVSTLTDCSYIDKQRSNTDDRLAITAEVMFLSECFFS